MSRCCIGIYKDIGKKEDVESAIQKAARGSHVWSVSGNEPAKLLGTGFRTPWRRNISPAATMKNMTNKSRKIVARTPPRIPKPRMAEMKERDEISRMVDFIG